MTTTAQFDPNAPPTPPPPNQERIWNAYGHAMAAAMGLELIMRIANMTARYHQIEASGGTENNKHAQHEKLKANAQCGTFGQVARQFLELYPTLASDLMVEATENAILFRNFLTHNYLAGHIRNLDSEEGLDIISTECIFYMDHFQRIENYIREESEVEFHKFGSGPEPTLGPHPLSEWIQGGETPAA